MLTTATKPPNPPFKAKSRHYKRAYTAGTLLGFNLIQPFEDHIAFDIWKCPTKSNLTVNIYWLGT